MPIAGPTAVVVVAKGLENKVRSGAYIAVGSALAEMVYAFMAFWGLTAALNRFPVLLPASRLLGCIILMALGFYFVFRKGTSGKDARPEPERVGYRNVLFGLSITALNPTLILTWTAAVSAAHSTGLLRVHAMDAFPFAGAVGIGIVTWFLTLLWLLSHFRKKVKPASLDRVIRGMGAILVVVGGALGARVLSGFLGHT